MSPLVTEMCLGLLCGMEAHQHKPAYIYSHPPEQHGLLQTDSEEVPLCCADS